LALTGVNRVTQLIITPLKTWNRVGIAITWYDITFVAVSECGNKCFCLAVVTILILFKSLLCVAFVIAAQFSVIVTQARIVNSEPINHPQLFAIVCCQTQ
jgi:hypothetical protein